MPVSQTSAAAFTTGYRFDVGRQLVGTISAAAVGGYHATRYKYDGEGRVRFIELGSLAQWQLPGTAPESWPCFSAKEVTERSYDVMGRLLSEKHSSNSGADPTFTQYSYDDLGRRECVATRMSASLYGSLSVSACTPSTPVSADGPDRITQLYYNDAGEC